MSKKTYISFVLTSLPSLLLHQTVFVAHFDCFICCVSFLFLETFHCLEVLLDTTYVQHVATTLGIHKQILGRSLTLFSIDHPNKHDIQQLGGSYPPRWKNCRWFYFENSANMILLEQWHSVEGVVAFAIHKTISADALETISSGGKEYSSVTYPPHQSSFKKKSHSTTVSYVG